MNTAGQFDKTVTVMSFTEAPADQLGHRTRTFVALRKCAARLWTRSAAEQSTAPAEFSVGTLQMLLYLPPAQTVVGWHILYSGTEYEIVDQDWRDAETTLLVTLAPV